jgi:plastocyanin
MVMPGPNGTSIAVAANNRSISPTVVKADGSVEYIQPNSTYTVDGTEKYINSGFTWPAGQVPPGFPPITTFSMKFENAGTYDYICALHPWMTGQVVVE